MISEKKTLHLLSGMKTCENFPRKAKIDTITKFCFSSANFSVAHKSQKKITETHSQKLKLFLAILQFL